jgi:hypothetical protein
MVTAAGTPQRCWAETAPGAIRLMNACCVRVPGVACAVGAYCRYCSDLELAEEAADDVGLGVALGAAAAVGAAVALGAGVEAGVAAAGAAGEPTEPGTTAAPAGVVAAA